MTDDAAIVARNALQGNRIAISVSDSADLSRLGLAAQHCELAVAELARAILIAGGTVVYGGRLVPPGFTQILLDEVSRYAADREALILCVAASEHTKLSASEIRQLEDQAGPSVSILCLDVDGQPVDPAKRDQAAPGNAPEALTAMRSYVTSSTMARVVVGGRLSGHEGSTPGVLEEVRMSLDSHQPLYIAGGFGGAAYAAARAMNLLGEPWGPDDLPAGREPWDDQLQRLADLAPDAAGNGLDAAEIRQLAVTHRPGDIASLAVLGLSRAVAGR